MMLKGGIYDKVQIVSQVTSDENHEHSDEFSTVLVHERKSSAGIERHLPDKFQPSQNSCEGPPTNKINTIMNKGNISKISINFDEFDDQTDSKPPKTVFKVRPAFMFQIGHFQKLRKTV